MARVRPRAQPPKVDGSNLGISVSMVAPIAIIRLEPSIVYFAKVDVEHGLFQPQVIPSNYSSHGVYYALNVEPGSYVAVGAHIGPHPEVGFTVYFSSSLVERTLTTVGDQELVYMGDHWVYMIPGLWGADAAQNHYLGVIGSPRMKPSLLKLMTGISIVGDANLPDYRGVMMLSRNDEAKRDEFFRVAKKDLKERHAALPVVPVANRFFWSGPEGNQGLEIKARFKSQSMLERVLRPDMVIGSYKDKNSSKARDWTLREILVSVNLNAAEVAAVWRVSGPKPLIVEYAAGLSSFSKKYPHVQDVTYNDVKFEAAKE